MRTHACAYTIITFKFIAFNLVKFGLVLFALGILIQKGQRAIYRHKRNHAHAYVRTCTSHAFVHVLGTLRGVLYALAAR